MDLTTEWGRLRCRVIDQDEARTTTHRDTLLILAQTFDYDGVTVLCEPSVVGARSGAPDIVVIDPHSGIHVVEVKGVTLAQVRAVNAGGSIEISYDASTSRKDPSRQARQSMFDIKDAASRHFNGELHTPFQSWVVFPLIKRTAWEEKFGEAVPNRPDVVFEEDLSSSSLRIRLQQDGKSRLASFTLKQCPPLQLLSVLAAFGDSEVLRPKARGGPTPPEGTKGSILNEIETEIRMLSPLQQRLVSRLWDDGPRLLRGVAGSGKTVVLATQVARMVERIYKGDQDLFDQRQLPLPVLAVCFNRTLVPFISERIRIAYKQRTGEDLPEGSVEITHLNSLLWQLSQNGYCKYRRISDIRDPGERSAQYLNDLENAQGSAAEKLKRGLFHSIYIDEGQDFHEFDYRVLLKICARTVRDQPRMFVFYDDAQNLYGLPRPVWSDLGLELRGRSVVMEECFRNTRQIVESAFNVLLGTHADDPQSVKTRSFSDTQTLKEKDLISFDKGHIRVHFGTREGDPVSLQTHETRAAEWESISALCQSLLNQQGLLPQDILILTYRRSRATELAGVLSNSIGPHRVRCASDDAEKDRRAIQDDQITVSTVASAKGYDAPYVIIAALDDFSEDVEGRSSFYVGCTRAREWLTVSAVGRTRLTQEFELSIDASNMRLPVH